MSQFIFPPLTASLDSEQSDGGALPSAIMIVGGYDGSAVQVLKTDSDGELQIDISTSALPSGAATATLQTTGNGILTTIDADTGSLAGCVSGSELQVDILTSALPSGAATSTLQTSGNTLLTTISTKDFATQTTLALIDADTSILSAAVSSGQMQVDIVADGAGLATTANQSTMVTKLTSIDGKDFATQTTLATIDSDTSILAAAVTANKMQVDVIASLPAGTNSIGTVVVGAIAPVDFLTAGVFDSSTGTNIPTGGSAVLVTLAADCEEIEVIDDIGEYMSLRLTDGTVKAYLPLGGGRVKCSLSTGDAMKLYSETGTTISSGKIAMNFLG